MLFAAKSVLNITRLNVKHISLKINAVLCDFILKCLESMRRYIIPFNEMLFNVAVEPHIIYNEVRSSDFSKNLIPYFKNQ